MNPSVTMVASRSRSLLANITYSPLAIHAGFAVASAHRADRNHLRLLCVPVPITSLIQQVLAAAKTTANQHTPASDQAEDKTERELKQGVFCSKCQAKMQSNVEIEGPMTCWMLNVAMLVMAGLTQHRLPALPLVCDANSIAEALKAVVDLLQEEAWNRDQARSHKLSRCAGMTPGDLFYSQAHHQFLLILIAQQIAQQQAREDRLAQRLAAPERSTARGPPSTFELHNSHFSVLRLSHTRRFSQAESDTQVS